MFVLSKVFVMFKMFVMFKIFVMVPYICFVDKMFALTSSPLLCMTANLRESQE